MGFVTCVVIAVYLVFTAFSSSNENGDDVTTLPPATAGLVGGMGPRREDTPTELPPGLEQYYCSVSYKWSVRVITAPENIADYTNVVSATLGVPIANVTFDAATPIVVSGASPTPSVTDVTEVRVKVVVPTRGGRWNESSMSALLNDDPAQYLANLKAWEKTAKCVTASEGTPNLTTTGSSTSSAATGEVAMSRDYYHVTRTRPSKDGSQSLESSVPTVLLMTTRITLEITVGEATNKKDQLMVSLAWTLYVPTENVTITSVLPGSWPAASCVVEFIARTSVHQDGTQLTDDLLAESSTADGALANYALAPATIVVLEIVEVDEVAPSPTPQVFYQENQSAIIMVIVIGLVLLILVGLFTAVAIILIQRKRDGDDQVNPHDDEHRSDRPKRTELTISSGSGGSREGLVGDEVNTDGGKSRVRKKSSSVEGFGSSDSTFTDISQISSSGSPHHSQLLQQQRQAQLAQLHLQQQILVLQHQMAMAVHSQQQYTTVSDHNPQPTQPNVGGDELAFIPPSGNLQMEVLPAQNV